MTDRELFDEDGENQAVRSFLMHYSCDRSLTVTQMRKHMKRSGWLPEHCPPFARDSNDGSHLTKAGAQIWIRHLFDLECAK
jgi:hypothetical protein